MLAVDTFKVARLSPAKPTRRQSRLMPAIVVLANVG
jgi:hypothetical protein